ETNPRVARAQSLPAPAFALLGKAAQTLLPVVLSSNQSNLVFIRNRLFGFPIGPVGGIDVDDLAEVVWTVLSENHIRTYWWCSPPGIGLEMTQPDRWTAV